LVVLSLGIVACTASPAATAPPSTASPGALSSEPAFTFTTKTPGVLLVGSDIPYVPFEFGDPPDYDGFDMDLMHEVADRLRLELEIQKTPFDTIFRDLAQGKFDMVASSNTITEERKKIVDFSLPYFNADQSLMVRRDSGISSIDDLAGRRVGVQLGGTGEHWARERLTESEIRTYDVVVDAFVALGAGQVDGVINDFPSSKYAEREYANLIVVQTVSTDERYGLVFPQQSDSLREAVNATLLEMKADGTLNAIYQKWFEIDAPDNILEE
jgi:ABC-type amino acid transport substrate-binding protein